MKKILSITLALLMIASLSMAVSGRTASDGTPFIDKTGWTIEVNSELWAGNVNQAFDDDVSTFWHSYYRAEGSTIVSQDTPPYHLKVTLPTAAIISGIVLTPRTDNDTGRIMGANVYVSDSDSGEYNLIKNGLTFSKDSSNPQEIGFLANIKVKRVWIEITASNGNFGTLAEFDLMKAKGRTASDGTQFIDKTGWKAQVTSELWAGNINQILDEDVSTYWHSYYRADGSTIVSQDNPPYRIEVTLPKEATISGIVLTPRTDNDTGRIMEANVYVSDSDNGEYILIKNGLTFSKDSSDPQEIEFSANIKVKRVKLEITASNGSFGTMGFGTLAEFDLINAKDNLTTIGCEEFFAYEQENQLYQIDNSLFTAEYLGENWGMNVPSNLFDGRKDTVWQTEEIPTSNWPVILSVDLKSVYGVKEIRYTPRQIYDHHGSWLNVTISGSTDGVNWQVLKQNINIKEDDVKVGDKLLTKKIALDSEAYIRYIKFQINDAVGGRAGGAELSFYQSKAAKDAYEAAEEAKKGKYVLRIGSNVIESTKAGVTKNTTIDVAPYIVNGSTMIPLRGLLEEMGAAVTWNGEDETVLIDDGANKLMLQIWNNNVVSYGTAYGDLIYSLLTPPMIKDLRTFIPIRFVSELLGYVVSWDAETQTVTIER